MTLRAYLSQARETYLRLVLELTNYNVTRAARHAGIHRETFHRWCNHYGIATKPPKRRTVVPPAFASLRFPGVSSTGD